MRRSGLIGPAIAIALLQPVIAAAQSVQPARPVQSRSTSPARPAASPAPASSPAAPPQQQSQVPPPAGLMVLIKSSLIALNQANQTGNYQVLYALGADALRAQTNPQNLAQSFAAFRERHIDLSPVIFLNPVLTRAAAIEHGRLHLVGTFPTQPLQIQFDFWFEPSQGRWKFVQLNTNLAPPQGQPQPGPQPQQRTPEPRRP